jgi:hypothetical protein
MKLVRILVLLVATSVLSVVVLQARGQQEVDPDHFDQLGSARASGSQAKTPASHKVSTAKNLRKPVNEANKRPRTPSRTRQARARSQPLPNEGARSE